MARNEAADLLWKCIVHDPRWDLQVESRSSFYADAAIALDFDVDRLRPAACPDPHDDVDQRLTVDVLGELAARRVRGAEPALLDHVRSGQQYDDAIYELGQAPGRGWEQLPQALASRFTEEECRDLVGRWRHEVAWDRIPQAPRWVHEALRAFDERSQQRREPEASAPPSMDEPARVILEFPWPGATPKRVLHRLTSLVREEERGDIVAALSQEGRPRWTAFQALAKLDDAAGLDEAQRIVGSGESGRDRAEALGYIKGLSSAHTLDRARSWLDGSAELQVAAQLVLERHAEVSDRQAIEQRLGETWKSRDFYGLCSWIDALALIPDERTFDLVEPVFEAAEYSYARGRAARAMTAADPQRFVSTFARSALWDCEDDVRRSAAQMLEGLPLDPLASGRVAEIQSDRARRRGQT
jgi:hypothetical protein